MQAETTGRLRSGRRRARSLSRCGLAVLAILTCGAVLVVARLVVVPLLLGDGSWDGIPLGGRWVLTGLRADTNAVAVDPSDPATVWAAARNGLHVSEDGGLHWHGVASNLPPTDMLSLAISPDGRTILAGGENGGIFEGTRNGATWRWRGINRPLGTSNPIFSLALSRNGRVLLAGTVDAIYRGHRAGHSWIWQRTARTNQSSITSIIWLPSNRHEALAAVFASYPSVLRTEDGGLTWHGEASGLPHRGVPTQQLIALPFRRPNVVLTTMGQGVWQWAGSGAWRDISAGLPERHAMPVIAQRRGKAIDLYAGTMGYGAYAREGEKSWRRFGTGLQGGKYTGLGIALAARDRLLMATAVGVYRYRPPT